MIFDRKTYTITKYDLSPDILALYEIHFAKDGKSARLERRNAPGVWYIVERTGKSHFRVTRSGKDGTGKLNFGGINAVNHYLFDEAAEQMKLAL